MTIGVALVPTGDLGTHHCGHIRDVANAHTQGIYDVSKGDGHSICALGYIPHPCPVGGTGRASGAHLTQMAGHHLAYVALLYQLFEPQINGRVAC